MLFDDDDLVDVQLEQANTEDMNVDAVKQDDAIKDTAAHVNEETTAPVNDDTPAQVIEDTTPHANEYTTAQVNEDTTANVVPANEDEARLKRRYDDFWQGQYNAGYRPPRRTSQRLAMNNYNRKTIHDYEGQGLTPDEAFEVE